MHINNIRQRGITHSLTPIPLLRKPQLQQYTIIPQSPTKNKKNLRKQSVGLRVQGSRKYRLLQQRNTQIEKHNRMLYQKIRKIMQKGHHSQKNIQPQISQHNADFLNTATKPISLPHVSSHLTTMRSTKSQLTNILEDRNKYIEKYFQGLQAVRNNLGKAIEMGNYQCNGWKIHVMLIDDQYIILKGTKGKKQLTKKYIWEKVKQKTQGNITKWVQSKFEFEL